MSAAWLMQPQRLKRVVLSHQCNLTTLCTPQLGECGSQAAAGAAAKAAAAAAAGQAGSPEAQDQGQQLQQKLEEGLEEFRANRGAKRLCRE